MRLLLFIIPVFIFATAHGQAKTSFSESTGEYATLLNALEKDMLQDPGMEVRKLGGKERVIFATWIRDHTHIMKAMKFVHRDMTSFLEFFLENQTPSGMYYDYFYPLNFGGGGASDRKNIFEKRYWKVFPKDSIEMHRLPVEADLEYLMVEGAYLAWQAIGDVDFVKRWLPELSRGMTYSMTDPLRWSAKHQLVKRGYTLDTWDFMQLPTSREEYTKNGGNVQKGIFDIDAHTPMGIMHGDNSGMYSACVKLSKLFSVSGNEKEAKFWMDNAKHFREKTNALCWNGKFYAHFIEDDPQPAYLKMDQRNTLSLSNPYDINRGLPTEQMAESIIKTYQDLKESNKKNSFAEWYGVYPPVKPHFADYLPGSYMNGGVNTIVGGELAKAAFQHGYESYGVDILKRIMELMNRHGQHLPVSYMPDGKVDEGIPDAWGQAAVYSAMIEGLAGVVDNGSQFRDIEISPRWLVAGKQNAETTVAYAASGKSISYRYEHNSPGKMITFSVNGPMEKTKVRILLPEKMKAKTVSVNGRPYPFENEQVRNSNYTVIDNIAGNAIELKLTY
jgi:hypothetical protein